MQNKSIALFGLILFVLTTSGCSNVQFREGSVFNPKAVEAETQDNAPVSVESSVSVESTAVQSREGRELTPPPYPSTSNKVDPLLQSSLQNIVNSNASNQEIMSELLDLQKRYPESSGVLYHLGRISFISNNPLEAITYLEQATELTPQNFYAHNLLGLVQRSLGEFKKARKHYKIALNIWPDYATAWYNLGVLEDIYFNNLDDALQAYKNYLAIQASKESNNKIKMTNTRQKQLDQVELWVRDLTNRTQK